MSSASHAFLNSRVSLGTWSCSVDEFKEWVANERFEGGLELQSGKDSKPVGKIVLTAHRKPIGSVVSTKVSVHSLCVHVKSVGTIVLTAHRKPIGSVVSTKVSVHSLCVHVKSVKAAQGEPFSLSSQHAVKITFGTSDDKTLLLCTISAVVPCDKYLCASFTSNDAMEPPQEFKIELLEREQRSLQNSVAQSQRRGIAPTKTSRTLSSCTIPIVDMCAQ